MNISIVVSVFNEEDVLEKFHLQLEKIKRESIHQLEIIYVNDGSYDNSKEILKKIAYSSLKTKIINFSRNFGHEAAMLAGIDYSEGDAIICMDADLQHPPNLISKMIKAFEDGSEIVTMIRTSREDHSLHSRLLSSFFYKIINWISDIKIDPGASDFFLISNKVKQILKSYYRDNNRFLRGVIQSIGFKKTSLTYEAPKRAGGRSKYSYISLLRLSLNALSNLTVRPLKIGLFFGIIFGIFSLFIAVFSIIMRFLEKPVSGYTTIIVFMSFGFSLMFILIGLIGDYLGKLYMEVKDKPIYLVEDVYDYNKNINP